LRFLNLKWIGEVGARALTLCAMGIAFTSIGCSSGSEAPEMTEAQKQQVQKEVEDQTSANDAAAKGPKTGKRTIGVMPP